jgi:hypothetical protein
MGNVSLNGASGKPGDIPEYVALHLHRELCQCRPFISPILVETKWTRLKRTQTRSWYNGRLVKAKISKEALNSKPSTVSSDEKNWLQASQRLDCRPRDSLERRGKSS